MTRAGGIDGVSTRIQQRLALGLLARLSKRHRADGQPQLAVFAHEHIGEQIAVYGRYENDLLTALDRFLSSGPKLPGCMLDVGANIGNHTVFFAQRFDVVHAFEPNPTTFGLLQLNTAAYANVHCHNLALSENSDRFGMVTDRSNIGGARLVSLSEDLESSCGVESVALDAWAKARDARVGLIKVDVEGHELQVFRGAQDVLRRDRPLVLFEQVGISEDVLTLLESLGYGSFAYFDVRLRYLPLRRLPRRLRGVMRLVLGESVEVQTVNSWRHLPDQFHAMVIALPEDESGRRRTIQVR
jgi:FkbM family methyltransferase